MFRSFFDPMPRVVAHRGDSAHFPENTLPAFESACRMGVDVIETDVHLSRDGHLVIWHDPTLERNTNGSGRVEVAYTTGAEGPRCRLHLHLRWWKKRFRSGARACSYVPSWKL